MEALCCHQEAWCTKDLIEILECVADYCISYLFSSTYVNANIPLNLLMALRMRMELARKTGQIYPAKA
jgi:hypothetical protein